MHNNKKTINMNSGPRSSSCFAKDFFVTALVAGRLFELVVAS
jgi:hypothetical protein